MKCKTIKTFLVLVGCVAFSNADISQQNLTSNNLTSEHPLATYDEYISPDGPNVTKEQLLDGEYVPYQIGSDTYTYVRCYYAVNSGKLLDTGTLSPKSDYVWANYSDGSYYKLHGYWYADGIFQWKNMFYTSSRLAEIRQICNDTVKRSVGVDKFSFTQNAANNKFSFNHTIWQNDNLASNLESFNKLIAFGDSLSDTNNMYNGSQWKLPNKNSYFQGRFSNGLVWTEYIASDLGLPLYNWAIGGAAGDKQYLVLSGFIQQVQSWIDYMSVAKNYEPHKSLFTILIGANDLVNYGRSVNDVTDDLKSGLIMLVEHGAKHIIISNLPDVSLAPVFHMGRVIPGIKQSVEEYNHNISNLVRQLQNKYPDVKIRIFDSYKMLNDAINNPSAYEIKNVYDPCLDINTDSSINYITPHNARASCSNANDFIFWDTLHITSKLHRIWATKVMEEI